QVENVASVQGALWVSQAVPSAAGACAQGAPGEGREYPGAQSQVPLPGTSLSAHRMQPCAVMTALGMQTHCRPSEDRYSCESQRSVGSYTQAAALVSNATRDSSGPRRTKAWRRDGLCFICRVPGGGSYDARWGLGGEAAR